MRCGFLCVVVGFSVNCSFSVCCFSFLKADVKIFGALLQVFDALFKCFQCSVVQVWTLFSGQGLRLRQWVG